MSWSSAKRRKRIRRLRAKYARAHGVWQSEMLAMGIGLYIVADAVEFSTIQDPWAVLKRRVAFGGRKGRSASRRMAEDARRAAKEIRREISPDEFTTEDILSGALGLWS